jgi:hypothetical protein
MEAAGLKQPDSALYAKAGGHDIHQRDHIRTRYGKKRAYPAAELQKPSDD